MTATNPIDTPAKPPSRFRIVRRLATFLRNLPNYPTALAFAYLARQIRQDPGYAASWHANLSVTIHTAAALRGEAVDPALCNAAASRIMKQFFRADTSGNPAGK